MMKGKVNHTLLFCFKKLNSGKIEKAGKKIRTILVFF